MLTANGLTLAGFLMLVIGLVTVAIGPSEPFDPKERPYGSLIVATGKAARVLAAIGGLVLLVGVVGLVLS